MPSMKGRRRAVFTSAALFGLNPFYFHLDNLILHIFNSLLVNLLVYRISSKNLFISIFAGLVFALHPMHVESVAWITERKGVDDLAAFIAKGFRFYDVQAEGGQGSGDRREQPGPVTCDQRKPPYAALLFDVHANADIRRLSRKTGMILNLFGVVGAQITNR